MTRLLRSLDCGMLFNSPEAIQRLTPLNSFERFADGRPRVPDDMLARMRLVTNEEAWGVLERGQRYRHQCVGNRLNCTPIGYSLDAP